MRSRTLREGSVGLLILIGIGLFGGLVIWLRGINPGNRGYRIESTLESSAGIQIGTAVNYRGVVIGRIASIEPQTNTVRITIEITQPGFVIPKDSVVETIQSGLIGETAIAIVPQAQIPESATALSPVGDDCDPDVIVCDGDALPGREGISYDTLIRSADQIADVLSDPELVDDIKAIARNTSQITDNFIGLSEELTALTQDVRQEIEPLSAGAQRTLIAVTDAVIAAGGAAEEIQLSAVEARSLLAANRANIATTLNNLSVSSAQLRTILDTVTPAIEESEFLANLEILSANAAIASANVRDITDAFNTPENLLMLQQTLESARDVFESAQKIMADIDELTGDPTFRNNIRDLVNGLSGLVSSTQDLQTQAQVAQILMPLTQEEGMPEAIARQPENSKPDPTDPNADTPAADVSAADAPVTVPILSHNGQNYTFRPIVLPLVNRDKAD
ncbi:MAG: MlaD family protein [Cyanobacteria bacterium P01_D01_bin.128]